MCIVDDICMYIYIGTGLQGLHTGPGCDPRALFPSERCHLHGVRNGFGMQCLPPVK